MSDERDHQRIRPSPTLAAKDDPTLIGGDEQHFATLATASRSPSTTCPPDSPSSDWRPVAAASKPWSGTWRSTG